MSGAGGHDDGEEEPFDDLVLDEAFVQAAARREPSAADRLIQRKRIEAEQQRLRDIERRDRARALETSYRSERRRGRTLVGLLVVALLVGGLYLASRRPGRAGEALSGTSSTLPGASATSPTLDARPRLRYIGGEPPAGVGEAPRPLGTPAARPATSGPYRFLQTQTHSSAPVAYDPCRPIHVVFNDRTEPPGADADVRRALAAASHYSGLRFIIDGTTTESPSITRGPYLPNRYPGRWAPVLIAWTDAKQFPDLAGSTAGFGGSTAVELEGSQVYVSGIVLLDGPQLGSEPDVHEGVMQTAEHEIGHLLGLAHVKDPTQIMNPVAIGYTVVDYAAGDQLGLEALGRGRCVPDI